VADLPILVHKPLTVHCSYRLKAFVVKDGLEDSSYST